MAVLEVFCVMFLPPIIYALVFLNGFVPGKLRACFAEAQAGLFAIHLYVVFVYLWVPFRMEIGEPWVDWFMTAMVLVMVVTSLDLFFSGLHYSYMERFQRNMGIRFGIFVVDLFLILMFSVTALNYTSYMLWPFLYEIPEGLTQAEIAFEFVYYTFMLLLTYNGGTIVPIHVASKVMQMVELVMFFACFGVVLTDLFHKLKGAAEAKANQEKPVQEVE